MRERVVEFIVPEGRVESGTYPGGDSYWMGEFSDGTVCGVAAQSGVSQNYVTFHPTGTPVPECPRKPRPLDERDLLVAMARATLLTRLHSPESPSPDN